MAATQQGQRDRSAMMHKTKLQLVRGYATLESRIAIAASRILALEAERDEARAAFDAERGQTVARVVLIHRLMDERDNLREQAKRPTPDARMRERCDTLLADNRRLRLALGHERPGLAVVRDIADLIG